MGMTGRRKKATVFVYLKINILRNELSQGQCILMTVYKGSEITTVVISILLMITSNRNLETC